VSWFISNVREAQWVDDGAFGASVNFQRGERFEEFGLNLAIVWPGQPLCMYHRESNQEGFLILAGECLLIVDGKERALREWDYFHCPAGTNHIIVGAGDGPAFLLAVGGRTGDGGVVYPVDEVALAHGAGVEHETSNSAEAYAPFPKPIPTTFDEKWLPAISAPSAKPLPERLPRD
jgi:uncharacterized cupin superfamily protein